MAQGIAYAISSPQSVKITALAAVGGLLAFVYLLHFIGWNQGKALATSIATNLGLARKLLDSSSIAAHLAQEKNIAAIAAAFAGDTSRMEEAWNNADDVQEKYEHAVKEKIANKGPALLEKNDALLGSKLRYVNSQRDQQTRAHDADAEEKRAVHIKTRDEATTALAAEEAAAFATIESKFKTDTSASNEELQTLINSPATNFPAWSKSLVESWSPTTAFSPATPFGRVTLDLAARPGHGRPTRSALRCQAQRPRRVRLSTGRFDLDRNEYRQRCQRLRHNQQHHAAPARDHAAR